MGLIENFGCSVNLKAMLSQLDRKQTDKHKTIEKRKGRKKKPDGYTNRAMEKKYGG